jgi:hypothetical protein
MTLDDHTKKTSLRVRMSESATSRGEIASVAKLEGDREIAVGIDAYDAFLAGTTLAADANEATLGTEDVTVEVGGTSYAGKKTTYRVRVGKRSAVMSTIESATSAWGDLGGEIKAKDGKLLYRAEVIELGHAAPDAAAPVANSDIEE